MNTGKKITKWKHETSENFTVVHSCGIMYFKLSVKDKKNYNLRNKKAAKGHFTVVCLVTWP